MAQKYTYNREMIGSLRTKVAVDMLEVLNETKKASKFGKFKKEMLLRLAPTVMPRVTEITGQDGEAVRIDLFDYTKNARKPNRSDNSDPKDTGDDSKDTSDTGGNGSE